MLTNIGGGTLDALTAVPDFTQLEISFKLLFVCPRMARVSRLSDALKFVVSLKDFVSGIGSQGHKSAKNHPIPYQPRRDHKCKGRHGNHCRSKN
jgi:hypothetical protein